MVRVSNLIKRYGRFLAVDALSFELHPGEVAGLLGPNGAGKTTTIRAITGYHRPDGGSIFVDGHDAVRRPDEARRRIGYLPENAPLYPEMTPDGYLHHRGRLHGMRRGDRLAAIDRVCATARVSEVRRKRIGQLSKGYRQRVGLAAALLHDPPVLVLDEPTNGLDPTQIRQTRALIRDLAAGTTGDGAPRTVLVSSHILAEIERTCDRVLILARGRLRADGAPEQLLMDFAGSHTVVAEVQGSGAPLSVFLSGLEDSAGVSGVLRESVGIDGQWTRVRIRPRGTAAEAEGLPELVGRLARNQGLLVRELRRERVTLEDLFVRLIEDDARGPVAAGADRAAAGEAIGAGA